MADRNLFDEGSILRQSASLRLMVRALVRDEAEAEDVVQETWLTAMRSQGPGFEPAAWLRGIARNVLRTVRRTDRRRSRREVESFTPGNAPSAADDAAKVERLRELLDLVSELREPARQAVILRYFDGLMPREIAERLGVPVATVKARIQTGLHLLREALDQRHGGDRSAWHAAFAGLVPEVLSAGAAAAGLPVVAMGGLLMKATAGVVGVIAVVAFLVWMGSRGPDSEARVEPGLAPGAVEGAPKSGTGTVDAIRISPRALDPGPEASPASSPASAPTPGELRVLVVSREGGAPVAGARVRIWDTSDVPTSRQDHLLNWDALQEPPASESVERITDALGFAAFPERPRRAMLFAEGAGKWGSSLYEEARGRAARIEIEDDLQVAVRVVDSAGVPVGGVPVRLTRFARTVRPIDFAYGLTRPDGVFLARHLQLWRGFFKGESFQSLMARLGASFDAGANGVLFDPASLPKEPLTLTLPPTGRINVKVVDAEGRPFAGAAYAGIKVREGPPEIRVVEEDRNDWSKRTVWRPVESGVASFPWVGLGATFAVKVHALDREHELASVERAGPTRAGEETEITVEVGPRLPVVRARVVDESGGSLKRHHVWVAPQGSPEGPFWRDQAIRTVADEDGAIRVPIREVVWKLRPGFLGFQAYDRADYYDSPATWRSVRALDAEMASRTDVDLGDVVMRRVPPLVAGVVRDDQGEPIGDAMVVVEVRALGDQRGFWDLKGIQSKTRVDGSFAISEPCIQGDLRLRVDAPGLRSEAPIEFQRGVTDLAVVVPRRASVVGSVILPEGVLPRDLVVSMSGECVPPRPKDGWFQRPPQVNPDGSFVIEGLRAGTGAFVLEPRGRIHANRMALVTIGGVEVAGVTRDPRLQAIDLRDRLRARALVVVDPDGNAVPGADVKYRPKGMALDSGATICETGVDGRATMVTGLESVSVTVSKEGYLDRELVAADPETKVVLDLAVTLEIAVKSAAALPLAPENLLISLAREGEPDSVSSEGQVSHHWDRPHATVDASGVATIKAPFTGKARLTVVVNREGESHEGGTLAIEIKPSPGRQRIEWRIPAEAIRRR